MLDTSDIVRHYEFAFSKTLLTEELIKAKQTSGADLRYLDRIGVIELTKSAPESKRERTAAEDAPSLERASSQEISQAPAARRKESAFQNARKEEASGRCEPRAPKSTPDEVLASLTPVQLAVLEAIPDDRAASADQLQSLGHPYGDTIAALTMLEIMGLLQKLPGGMSVLRYGV